jgi:hypothetical protein
MVFKWRDDHTQLVLGLLSKQECLWNVKSENYRNRNIGDKALEETAKQLNIPDLTQEDVKLKIKSIPRRYSSELANILKSKKKKKKKKVVLAEMISMYRNYSGSNKLIYSCVPFVDVFDAPSMLRSIIHGLTRPSIHPCMALQPLPGLGLPQSAPPLVPVFSSSPPSSYS